MRIAGVAVERRSMLRCRMLCSREQAGRRLRGLTKTGETHSPRCSLMQRADSVRSYRPCTRTPVVLADC